MSPTWTHILSYKPKNKANVATARELACWCWAIGRMVENG